MRRRALRGEIKCALPSVLILLLMDYSATFHLSFECDLTVILYDFMYAWDEFSFCVFSQPPANPDARRRIYVRFARCASADFYCFGGFYYFLLFLVCVLILYAHLTACCAMESVPFLIDCDNIMA
jgi:hypothetical protein